MQFGSTGEREVQKQLGSEDRAHRFYDSQMQDHLTEKMQQMIARQEMMFIATADSQGNCDCSPRFGSQGFVRILNPQTLAFPDYRGNGVFASLGNIYENPHIGMVFVDFFDTTVGLHVNGAAVCYINDQLPDLLSQHLETSADELDRVAESWVIVTIHEAYIHCSKHVPLLKKEAKEIDWGTDDPKAKSTDYFSEK